MLDNIVEGCWRERHRRVRAAIVIRGSSLSAWCAANGATRQNADKALLGRWTGPKAAALIERIERAAGVKS
jgi:hypothetical protein